MAYEETTNPLRGVEAHPGSGHYGVFDHGAHVWAYQPDGAQPVLWMSQKSQFAEGKPVRGGVPVVFPWFAAGPEGNRSPAHGYGRLDTWHRSDIKDTLDADGRLLVEYELDDAMDHQDFHYDYTAYLRAKFTPEYLQIALEVTNEGEEPFTFEEALHTYLAIGDIRQLSITGLDGVPYLDRAANAPKLENVQSGEVRFSGETDRIYSTTGALTLDDPVLGRKFEVTKSGSASTIVWNPWVDKAAAMEDFGDDEWTGMVCIEAGNVLDQAITLRPGEKHLLKQRITLL